MATANDSALQELVEWNTRYWEKFGFVFLICASGRSTPEILAELKVIFSCTEVIPGALFHRITGAHIMAIPLLPSCETTEISGSSHYTCPPASTHVLDVAHGSPASGTEVHLGMWKGTHQHPSFTNRESTDWTLIVSMMTNADGCSGPLMGIVDHITPGFNRISFNTALWQDPVWWALLTLMVFNSASGVFYG
ncbi:5-hydroxyisourate hydrolase [Musa troglodytarum]|uniref:2-oxo-4-hydroxy-4-carboxy-5-ureidoimidazoline decarboxylase n=1 Tax=Musa troglodytarum TaxID=320322 RepID=A0A9E7K4Z4_9LILI|nr:5-hydroxyisourate hydrolase [Musa troglodytarum]